MHFDSSNKEKKSDLLLCHRIDDGILEVIGIYSSFHIAQLQVGLSEPLFLGQAKTVKVC